MTMTRRSAAPVAEQVHRFVAARPVRGRHVDEVTPNGRAPLSSPDELAAAARSGATVVFDNPRTLNVVARSVADPALGRWMTLMGTLPLSRIIVATKALSEVYRCGEERTKLSQWAPELGINPDNPWGVVEHLCDGIANRAQARWHHKLHRLGDGLAESLSYGTSGVVMNGVYTSLGAATNCQNAYWACDEVRVSEYISTGDSCRVTITRVHAGRVTGWLSSPCKTKLGDLMVFDGSDSPGNVKLLNIGYDPHVKRLYGVFTRPDTLVKGFAAIESMGVGSEFVISEVPYVSTPRSGRSPWASSAYVPPAPGRIVPADVLALVS